MFVQLEAFTLPYAITIIIMKSFIKKICHVIIIIITLNMFVQLEAFTYLVLLLS